MRTRLDPGRGAQQSAGKSAGTARKGACATAVVLAAVCLIGLFSTEIADTDFWWHLKTGQYIVQRHSLPVPDPFGNTVSVAAAYPGEERVRQFNLTHEWLSQVFMYAVY